MSYKDINDENLLPGNPFLGLLGPNEHRTYQYLIDMLLDPVNGCAVPCKFIFANSKWVPCVSCNNGMYDPSGQPIYRNGCGKCKNGMSSVEEIKELSIVVEFDSSKFSKVADVDLRDISAQTMCRAELEPVITSCEYAILNSCDCDNRFKLASKPIKCGLFQKSYLLSNWSKI